MGMTIAPKYATRLDFVGGPRDGESVYVDLYDPAGAVNKVLVGNPADPGHFDFKRFYVRTNMGISSEIFVQYEWLETT